MVKTLICLSAIIFRGMDGFSRFGFVKGDLLAAPVIRFHQKVKWRHKKIAGRDMLLIHEPGFGIGVGFQTAVRQDVLN